MGGTSELNIVHQYGFVAPTMTASTGKSGVTVTISQIKTLSNGLGFVVQLSDGSFIIVDGGRASGSGGDHAQHVTLYNTMKSLNGGSEKNIVIRAWVLTHAHGDHVEAFQDFSATYASKVTLENIFYASTANTYYAGFEEDVASFAGVNLVSVHTGMRFAFKDILIDFLYAPSELYKNFTTDDFNNSSLIFSFKHILSGYSMTFLADAGDDACNRLVDIYGSTGAIYTDMIQVSHHGYEDAPISVYEALGVSAGVVDYLWFPANQSLYEQAYSNAYNTASTVDGSMHDRNGAVLDYLWDSGVKHLFANLDGCGNYSSFSVLDKQAGQYMLEWQDGGALYFYTVSTSSKKAASIPTIEPPVNPYS